MIDRTSTGETLELLPANSDRWPLLIKRDEAISLKEAMYRTGKNEKTIRRWCREHRIARQTSPGAPLEISAPGLLMVFHGDIVALELLREERRNHPRVRRHFEHLGLPC